MDPEERVELVQKVREFAPKEKLIIAGAGCEGIYISKYMVVIIVHMSIYKVLSLH